MAVLYNFDRYEKPRVAAERGFASAALQSLAVLAIAGGLAVAAFNVALVGAGLAGLHAYNVLSGSMGSAMPTGSVILDAAVPAATIHTGDVITFPMPGNPSISVTHRVRAVLGAGQDLHFVTKGDANAAPDAWVVTPSGPVQKAVVHIPFAGNLGSAWVRLALFVIPALLLVSLGIKERPERDRRRSPGPHGEWERAA